MENLYEVLGIAQDAGGDEIKKAYRRLSKKYHPDANPGSREAEEQFARVAEAYSVLQDPEKRRKYDLTLKKGGKNPSMEKAAGGHGNGGVDFSDLESRFSQFFGFNPGRETADRAGAGMGKGRKNPIDMTDVFEKYMGIRK